MNISKKLLFIYVTLLTLASCEALVSVESNTVETHQDDVWVQEKIVYVDRVDTLYIHTVEKLFEGSCTYNGDVVKAYWDQNCSFLYFLDFGLTCESDVTITITELGFENGTYAEFINPLNVNQRGDYPELGSQRRDGEKISVSGVSDGEYVAFRVHCHNPFDGFHLKVEITNPRTGERQVIGSVFYFQDYANGCTD